MSLTRRRLDIRLVPEYDNVVDFQGTRMSSYVEEAQFSMQRLVQKLSHKLDIQAVAVEDATSDGLCLIADVMDIQRTSPTTAVWSPLCLFKDGVRLLQVHMQYGPAGASLLGITLHMDGDDAYTPCTTLVALERLCLFYADSLSSGDLNEDNSGPDAG